MTIGDGIFYSTILLVLAGAFYAISVGDKWKAVGKVFSVPVLVAAICGVIFYASDQYQIQPQSATSEPLAANSSSSPYIGASLEGKGLICNVESGAIETLRGFSFGSDPFDDRVEDINHIGQLNSFMIMGDSVWRRNSSIQKFSSDANYIRIEINDQAYVMNRKNGVMVAPSYTEESGLYYCQVYQNQEAYKDELTRLNNTFQDQYDKKREGNVL